MRLKTMNKRINQARLDVGMVLSEFEIQLASYLRANVKHSTYVDVVNCSKVSFQVYGFLTGDMLEVIQDKFFLELETFEEVYSASGVIVYVRYNFKHKKLL